MSADPARTPIYALRAINVRGRDYKPGDELPDPPSLVERGLATEDPALAARLREIADVQRELHAARRRAYDLEQRLTELRGEAS